MTSQLITKPVLTTKNWAVLGAAAVLYLTPWFAPPPVLLRFAVGANIGIWVLVKGRWGRNTAESDVVLAWVMVAFTLIGNFLVADSLMREEIVGGVLVICLICFMFTGDTMRAVLREMKERRQRLLHKDV